MPEYRRRHTFSTVQKWAGEGYIMRPKIFARLYRACPKTIPTEQRHDVVAHVTRIHVKIEVQIVDLRGEQSEGFRAADRWGTADCFRSVANQVADFPWPDRKKRTHRHLSLAHERMYAVQDTSELWSLGGYSS